MKDAVFYKGVWLAKNSEAKELYDKQEFQKLDKLMKEVDTAAKELMRRYEPKVPK